MGRNLMAQIAKYLSSQKRRKAGYWVLFGLSAVVVFCTTYALILPAITISNELRCGMEAHTHSESCWSLQPVEPKVELTCEDWKDADIVFHHHDGFCYDGEGQLICPLEEQEAHVHGEQCYIEERELICGQEEGDALAADESAEPVPEVVPVVQPQTRPHVHTDECYTMERGALVCGQDEFEGHVHNEACYVMKSTGEYVFACGQVETIDGPHHHDETCMVARQYPVLICEQEESEGHAHSDDCYEWEKVLICEKTEEPVPFQPQQPLVMPEPAQPEEPHVHTDECYESTLILVCQEEEAVLHTHGPGCYDTVRVDDGQGGQEEREVLICTLPVVIEHQHTEACFQAVESEDKEVMVRTCGMTVHVHTDECYVDLGPEPDPHVCGLAEHQHSEECWFESGELRCTIPEHTHEAKCLDPDSAPKMEYPLVPGGNPEYTCGLTEHTHTDSCRGESWMSCLREEHLHGDTCWLNGELVCVQEEHVHTDVCWQEGGFTCGLEEHEHMETCWNKDDDPTLEDEDDLYLRDEDGNLILDEDGNPILEDEDDLYLRDEDGNLILDEDGNPILKDDGEEDEELSAMTLLPYGAKVPEGYTEQFDCADPYGAFAVTVYAPEEALPEGAKLVARLLPEGSAEYREAASDLDEDSYDGMVALDIHFEVEGWGEIEPFKPVYVVINAMGVLPADADPDSVVIRHHEETADSGIMTLALMDEEDNDSDANAVVVADSSTGTGAVEVSDDDVAAAFEVDSFSYFTIVYKGNGNEGTGSLSFNLMIRNNSQNNDNHMGTWSIPLNRELQITSAMYGLNTDILIEDILMNSNVNLGTIYYNDGTKGTVYVREGHADVNTAYNRGYNVKAYTSYKKSEAQAITAVRWTGSKWQGRLDGGEYIDLENKGTKADAGIFVMYEEAKPQEVLYFVIKPEVSGTFSALDLFPEGSWYYFGHGTILRNANTGRNGAKSNDWFANPSDPTNQGYYPYDERQVVDRPFYPETIVVDGVTYYYKGALDSKSYEEQVSLIAQYGENFYDVEWVRFADARGTNPRNAYLGPDDDPYNRDKIKDTTATGTIYNIWHIDGYLVLGAKVQVKYYVLDENGNPADLPDLTNGFYAGAVLDKGETAEQKTFTYSDAGFYGSGSFSDWYFDKECTKPYLGEPIYEDTDLYHKIMPESYNLIVGKVAGTSNATSTTSLAGLPGLNGATFELYDNSETKISELSPEKLSGQSGIASAATSKENVFLKFGEVYKLVETVAPDGYNKLTEPIYFMATREATADANGVYQTKLVLCDSTGGNTTDKYYGVEVDGMTIIVANYGGYKLPETGGPTAFMYTTGGALLCIAAGSLLYSKKSRRKGADDRA